MTTYLQKKHVTHKFRTLRRSFISWLRVTALVALGGSVVGVLCAGAFSLTLFAILHISNSSYRVITIFLLFILLSNIVAKIFVAISRRV